MIYHCAYNNPRRVKWAVVLIFQILLKNELFKKVEPKVNYSLVKYENKGSCYILTDISENFTMVQLMDTLGNTNHDISAVGYFIFDSNYKIALVLT